MVEKHYKRRPLLPLKFTIILTKATILIKLLDPRWVIKLGKFIKFNSSNNYVLIYDAQVRKACEFIKVGEWGTKSLGLKSMLEEFFLVPTSSYCNELTGENTELMVLLLCLKN